MVGFIYKLWALAATLVNGWIVTAATILRYSLIATINCLRVISTVATFNGRWLSAIRATAIYSYSSWVELHSVGAILIST